MRRLTVVLLAVLGAALLCAAAPATASRQQLSIMQDDDQLLYRGDTARDFSLRRMRDLGADVVRVTVLWEVAAHRARRRGFHASDHATYPAANWDRYDELVKAAGRLQLGVLFNVTGPGPRWAHGRTSNARLARSWKPSPREFGAFVTAVGQRYSGAVVDTTDGVPIPRVYAWSIWNEPNQAGWLAPQWEGGRPASPALYRSLYGAGRRALDRTGHGRDHVLAGETAPLGRSQGSPTGPADPMRPRRFIRELLCERPSARGCSRQRAALRASGWAHHPYSRGGPRRRDRHPDSITMANLGSLGRLLDRLAARTGRIARGLPVLVTEYGWETNPPDPYSGVSLARQAQWMNEGELLAYRNPRVAAMAQFLLRDVNPVAAARRDTRRYWFTYQSGLFDATGAPKPAASAYALPLALAGRRRDELRFWGQLRFAPNGTPGRVKLQWKPDAGVWEDVGAVETVRDPRGFFTLTRPDPGPGRWRAIGAGGTLVIGSREVAAG